ncbi:SH3 and multiple ankyrin repeat domains protein 1 isoform X5 [Zootermopsis nevadensis]|uniref:SH3 and multiple ankyrin repeat domains protein 1 isoform X5 n=1 Tax=Zootermopsis nevadensis TaxID=136037 RepID=UPI000B8EC078|nr:SH3 and multiple ankyrin repeat domains protein 1 isoform X5 [Zootermopsis nevadensis]
MIGSFWNLCRTCPSMPVDKLHSEYRSTYRWHEYMGQEVVRRPPQPSTGGNPSKLQTAKSVEDESHPVPRFEPALPRRKKHPELAYKTHEFMAMSEAGGSDDSLESAVTFDRARSEERGGAHTRPSRRSKSEGPPTGTSAGVPSGPALSEYRLQYMNMSSPPPRAVRSDSDPCVDEEMAEKDEELKKDIPRSRKDYLIRHHLERTTGAVDGALLPSPTREKLEPVTPRQKEEDLPKSPQKASPKSSPRSARSQSVGLAGDNRSPKRQPRTPLAAATQPSKVNGPVQTERRPRPSGTAPCQDELDSDRQLNKEGPDVEPALVKSPPEPTRVKSPEQILMRSPEPVNWTVPLDTGKTFTVTQNVLEALPSMKLYRGELTNRPYSEVKAWTPPAVPPPAPQSAPPELLEQTSGWKSPDPMIASIVGGLEAVNGLEEKPSTSPAQFDTSVAVTALQDLEDSSVGKGVSRPGSETLETQSEMGEGSNGGGGAQGQYRILESSIPTLPQESPTKPLPLVSPSSGRSLASDVLEKARTRFDKFWGKGKDSSDEKV